MGELSEKLRGELLGVFEKTSPEDLRAMLQKTPPKELPYSSTDQVRDGASVLKAAFQEYAKHYEFSVGDVVRWKSGLRNRLRPVYNQPAIVAEIIQPPLFDESKNASSGYFREPLTIVLGLFDEDNEFFFWHFDIKRFEPHPDV